MNSAHDLSVIGLAALLLAAAAPAWAVDPRFCSRDNVSEVPAFAEGRDASDCLMVDPGNGDAPVPFQFEWMHKYGAQCGAKRISPELTRPFDGLRCSDFSGESCTYLYYDVTVDNYLDRACKNEDGIFMPGGMKAKYLYFKNSKILNSWKCAGGSGWSGPNGIGCAAGEDSTSHTDGIQMRGLPGDGGWAVFQDTEFLNGHNLHFLHQLDSDFGRGSMLFQGVHFGRAQRAGAAISYIDDCKARGVEGTEICEEGRTLLDAALVEFWFVDVWGTSTFSLKGAYDKVVIVNTGCGKSGCTGTIGYASGWPHPVNGAGTGPGTCPNGPIPSSAGGIGAKSAYCFTSLERAIAAGHKPPPFVHLSAAGWDNPPAGTPPPRPPSPSLFP